MTRTHRKMLLSALTGFLVLTVALFCCITLGSSGSKTAEASSYTQNGWNLYNIQATQYWVNRANQNAVSTSSSDYCFDQLDGISKGSAENFEGIGYNFAGTSGSATLINVLGAKWSVRLPASAIYNHPKNAHMLMAFGFVGSNTAYSPTYGQGRSDSLGWNPHFVIGVMNYDQIRIGVFDGQNIAASGVNVSAFSGTNQSTNWANVSDAAGQIVFSTGAASTGYLSVNFELDAYLHTISIYGTPTSCVKATISGAPDNAFAPWSSTTNFSYTAYIPADRWTNTSGILNNGTNAYFQLSYCASSLYDMVPQVKVNTNFLSSSTSDGYSTVSGLYHYGQRAVSTSKVALDGLTVYLKTNSLKYVTSGISSMGLCFSFVKSNDEFEPDYNNRFTCNLWSKYFSSGKMARWSFAKNHYDNHSDYNIAYYWTGSAMSTSWGTNGNMCAQYSGMNDDTEIGIKMQFWDFSYDTTTYSQFSSNGYFMLTVEYLYGSATLQGSPQTTLFIDAQYFTNAMDSNGEAYMSIWSTDCPSDVTYQHSYSLSVKTESGHRVRIISRVAGETRTFYAPRGATMTMPTLATSDADGNRLIGYWCDNKIYPNGTSGMIINKDNDFYAAYADISWHGTSVNKSAYFGGMRFGANVDGSEITSVFNRTFWDGYGGGTGIKSNVGNVGIIVMPTDLITSGEFTKENYPSTSTGGVADFSYDVTSSDMATSTTDLDVYGSVINMQAVNYNRKYSARIYCEYNFNGAGGLYNTVFYFDEIKSECIFDIAVAAIGSSESDPYNVLHDYAESVLKLSDSGTRTKSITTDTVITSCSGTTVTESGTSYIKLTITTNATYKTTFRYGQFSVAYVTKSGTTKRARIDHSKTLETPIMSGDTITGYNLTVYVAMPSF